MLNRLMQNAGLALYSGLSRSGVLSRPVARRTFLRAYGLYKRWIEAGPVDQLKPFVAPGSVVVDIGANVGFFTLKFADWVGPSGHVLAVEPEPSNYAALLQALAKSGLQSRVTPHQAVAAEAPGTLLLNRNEIHPGDHKIALGSEAGIAVAALTLDALVGASGRGPVSLIKIDVQGAEMMVLAGAGGTLGAQAPALFIEIDDGALKRFGSSAEELVDVLGRRGYLMHRLVKDGAPRRLDAPQLRKELASKAYVDVLFVMDPAVGPSRPLA